MPEQPVFQAGDVVRLTSDPGRIGTIRSARLRGSTTVYKVRWPEVTSTHPEYELEAFEEKDADTLLDEGKFGNVKDLRRNLSYVQLSGRLANVVYSMDTTNTEFFAYQFKPVLSFLDSPSNGILIADEVGLGKTIEAGLIWTELRARYDARRLLVVCPAMLREKWRDELRYRFGVRADILDATELLDELSQGSRIVDDGRGIICSLQGLRPPRGWEDHDEDRESPRLKLARLLDEARVGEPIIDLLVVDEAHYLRNPESQTAELGRMLRGVSEHVVLLSATPINLRSDDLFHLLNLVDPDTFDRREFFPEVLTANEPLQKARELALDRRATLGEIKSLLEEARQHYLFRDNRQLEDLTSAAFVPADFDTERERIRLANRIERVNTLTHVVNRTRKREVTEWKVVRNPVTEFITIDESGPERRFYEDVTAAVRKYAIDHGIVEGFLLASPQRQVSSCMYAAAKSWTDRASDPSQAYEDLGIELFGNEEESLSPLMNHLYSTVLPTVDLDELRAIDSKYKRFKEIVIEYLNQNPGEKIIVFSFFRGTLQYLSERLQQDGIENEVLMGGMRVSKHDVISRFRESLTHKVLLSSEVASEGVDLQFSRVLVNYDLPWNPMKVEQRIGRIDRLGQKADSVAIWNLGHEDTIDQRINDRLFERLDIFRRALGGMEAILSEEIKQLTTDLLRNKLTPEQEEERIEQTALAIEKNRQANETLENDAAHLVAHGGYILEQVHAAKEFNRKITERDLVIYVKDYLDRYARGYQFLEQSNEGLHFDIQLPPDTAAALDEYIRREKLFGQTKLARGDVTRCQFVNRVSSTNERTERISQFHPLVRFISEEFRKNQDEFFPLVAANLDRSSVQEAFRFDLTRGIYCFVVSLWNFTGLRVEEELRVRARRLDSDEFMNPDQSYDLVNKLRLFGRDWRGVSNYVDTDAAREAMEQCWNIIGEDFSKSRQERENENADRVNFQVQSAERHRVRQTRMLEELLIRHEQRGNLRLLAPTRGKIAKVRERFENQKSKLELKGRLLSRPTDVCAGLILVT